MSSRAWWMIVIALYVALLVWLLFTLSTDTTCSATYPC